MNRRHLLILAFAAALGIRPKMASALSVRSPTLAELCKRSSVVAVVDQFKTTDVKSKAGECGPKTEANVSRLLLGRSGKRLVWRGWSVFNLAPTYVLFAAKISLAKQVEYRLASLPEEEKEKAKQLIESCSALQSELSSLYALPVFTSITSAKASVLLARDEEDLAYFAPNIETKMLSRDSRGFTMRLDHFKNLVQKLSHA